jgi:hypothetical protein
MQINEGSPDDAPAGRSVSHRESPEKASAPDNLQVEGHFDPATSTISYIVFDRKSRACALIDSVLGTAGLRVVVDQAVGAGVRVRPRRESVRSPLCRRREVRNRQP